MLLHGSKILHFFSWSNDTYCMDIPHFVTHSLVDGYLSCFHFLEHFVLCTNIYIMLIIIFSILWSIANYEIQVFLRIYVFSYYKYIPMSRITGSYANFMFNILRNCQIYPKLLHITFLPGQHLLLSVFFTITIIVGVRWYLVVGWL